MSRRKLYAALGGVALVAVVTLALVFGVFGGQPQGAPATQANLASAAGAQDAIQVHGHWTIEVRNADGSLVSRHEFNNSLTDPNFLSEALAGMISVGKLEILLSDSNPAQNPFGDGFGGRSGGCIFLGAYSTNSLPYGFGTLTVGVPQSPPNQYCVVLSGTATAGLDGAIDTVATWVAACGSGTAPSDCLYNNGYPTGLTGRTLGTPISVSAGQQILVTVVISFS